MADAKRSRLAVLYAQKDKYSFAFATVHADIAVTAQPLLSGSRLSLAAGLASSLTCRSSSSVGEAKVLSWKGTLTDPPRPNAVEKGVQLLEDACEKVWNGSKEISDDSFLRNAFDLALKEALGLRALVATTNGRNEDNPQDAILSKNGGKINGLHHSSKKLNEDLEANGHHHPASADMFSNASSTPQIFVDSAASLIVDILCMPFIELEGTVSSDARFLLRHLVRCGNLSARTGLVSRVDMNKTFSNVLRSLEQTAEEEEQDSWSAYAPFDLANDILKHCSDVSEHQMVAALHYVVSRAPAKDVAAFFIRNKSFDEDHPFLKQIIHFSALESKRKLSASDKDELSGLGRKLILSGLATLVKGVVEYSPCNGSLLRNALETEFSEKGLRFFARFFVDMLSSPEKFYFVPQAGAVRNSMCWLSALCDCMQKASPSSEEVKHIRRAIATQLSAAGTIASLQGAVEDALSGSIGRTEPGDQTVKREKSPRTLPPYQIERLVF